MLKGNALRHQMVLPEQQKFYDYWRSKCRGDRFPRRADIEPADICAQLPMVTLTERQQHTSSTEQGAPVAPHRYCFRLAGTGFWRFYGDEIQGQFVDQLPIGSRADYWHRVLDMVVDQRRPFHGVTKPETPVGSHMVQFWVRLPLSEDGVTVDTILGYDHICPLEQALQTVPTPQKVYA